MMSASFGSRRVSRRVLVVMIAAVVAACGGNESGPSGGGGSGGGGSLGARMMTATIDGQPFSAVATGTQSTATASSPALLLISGVNTSGPGSSTTLTFSTNPAVGTTNFGPGNGYSANMLIISPAGGSGWLAVQTQGSGTVTVTSLTSAEARGTFSFTMLSTSGGPPKTITSGSFYVIF